MEPAIPGALLADRYLLVRPLGTGGSATVWEATDTVLGRKVAVKLLRGGAAGDTTERERLRREARALAQLAHPRICAIHDYAEIPAPEGGGLPMPMLVTELLDGVSLSQRLARGPMPWRDAVTVCAQLADALLAAHHAGIVHRDVKPANVMLVGNGVKLLDFGIARAAGDGDLTGNLTVGTPLCMSPEQVRGHRAQPASDIYSLGCVLHWALTGRPPFQSRDVTEVFEAQLYDPPPPIDVPGMPARIAEFCHACLTKNPSLRPNAAEAVTVLSGFATQIGPTDAGSEQGSERALPGRRRRSRSGEKGGAEKGGAQKGALEAGGAERTGARAAADPQGTAAWAPPTRASVPYASAPQASAPRPAAEEAFRPTRPSGSGLEIVGTAAERTGASEPRIGGRNLVVAGVSFVVVLALGAVALLLVKGQPPRMGAASGGPAATSAIAAPPVVTGAPQTSASAAVPTAGGPSSNAGADPIAYLEQVRAQIGAFVAEGPATLDPVTAGDLQNSIIDIENSVVSAKRNGGAAHLREIRNKISQFDGRLHGLVGKARISAAAAGELTNEVQQVSETVTD